MPTKSKSAITKRPRVLDAELLAAIHPGTVISEEYLKPIGMSVNALASALRLSATRLNSIVRRRRGVTADIALRLARYWGTSARFWMNLQSAYELEIATAAVGEKVNAEVRPKEGSVPQPVLP